VTVTFEDGSALPPMLALSKDGGVMAGGGGAPIPTGPDGVARRDRLGAGRYRVSAATTGGRHAEAIATVSDDAVTPVAISIP
jgi:hypothetical protein